MTKKRPRNLITTSVNLPQDWLLELEQYYKDSGNSRSTIIREAVWFYLCHKRKTFKDPLLTRNNF